MLLREAKAMLNEEVKKINLAINADFLPEDKRDVFSEYLGVCQQPLALISSIDIPAGACVDFREVQNTDDLALLVFERSRGGLEQLIERAKDLLERLNKSQSKNQINPKGA